LQWYLLAGLIFPLFVARSRWLPVAILAGMAATSMTFPGYRTLSGNLVSFAFGVAVFQFSIGRFSKPMLAGALFGLALASQKVLGPEATAFTLLTALAIGCTRLRWPPLTRIGEISYSLYLLHRPIGGRVLKLAGRYAESSWARSAALGFAVLLSVATAWLFWRFVERPSQARASRVRFKASDDR
jgi:peptidoglycan/LPS O-acetylase OafA/YrhL